MESSTVQPRPFHEVALEQIEEVVKRDEAVHAIALLHTLARVEIPKDIQDAFLAALCALWNTDSFQEWVYEGGSADDDVSATALLINRMGGCVELDADGEYKPVEPPLRVRPQHRFTTRIPGKGGAAAGKNLTPKTFG